jgi:hypothetical protein
MPTPRLHPMFALSGSSLLLVGCALPSAQVSVETQPTTTPEPTAEAKPAKSRPRVARQPPRVIQAELRGAGDRLQLQFSEPLAPVDGVDPNDFRLSMAMAYAYPGYAYAYYYDLGELFGDGDEDTGLMTITALVGEGDTLELSIHPPIEFDYCREIEREMLEARAEPGGRLDGGLYLHYSPGERPITDTQGDELRPAAGEWVLRGRAGGDDAYEMYFEGHKARRALRHAIPIHCGTPSE